MDAIPETFPRLLREHGRARPHKCAYREKYLGIWQTWTWVQVNDEVRALACGLAALGFARGMNLAIIGDNRPRLYWAMLAAQSLGGVPVPLYQDAPAADMAYVLDNAEIAYAAGFRNVSHFSRVFTERYQMPPSAVRTLSLSP